MIYKQSKVQIDKEICLLNQLIEQKDLIEELTVQLERYVNGQYIDVREVEELIARVRNESKRD